jgi:hypothetical protein
MLIQTTLFKSGPQPLLTIASVAHWQKKLETPGLEYVALYRPYTSSRYGS